MTDIEQLIREGLRTDLESLDIPARPRLASPRRRRRASLVGLVVAGSLALLALGFFVVVQRSDRPEPTPAPKPEDTWSRGAPLPLMPRTDPFVAWVGGRLLVIGGERGAPCAPEQRGCFPTFVRDGASYDPVQKRWTRISSAPRGFTDAVGVGSYVFALTFQGPQAYDTSSDSWEPLSKLFPDSMVHRPGPGRLAAYGDTLYLAPGGGSFYYNGGVEACRLQTHTCHWVSLSPPARGLSGARLTATSQGPVWVGIYRGPLTTRANTAEVFTAGQWRVASLPKDVGRAAWTTPLPSGTSLLFTLGDRPRGALDLASGEWAPLERTPGSGALRHLSGSASGWALAGGRLFAPDGSVTELTSPPGVDVLSGAAVAINQGTVAIVGGWHGGSYSDQVWIRQAP